MFFTRFTLFSLFLFVYSTAIGRDKDSKIKFGDINSSDFTPVNYALDTSAGAVFLYERGSSIYEITGMANFSIVFEVHERIRLMNKKSFDELATVKILLADYGKQEKLDDFKAATYNLKNGEIITTKVDKNSVFRDKDGMFQVLKFTFPNLKEGCIIEYTYTKTIPYPLYVPSWNFQRNYPKLWSEYYIEVPEIFDLVVLKQGYLQPVTDTAVKSVATLGSTGLSTKLIKHTWAYADIPAIKEENFITSLSNYIQSVEFQLAAIRFPRSEPVFYMHTWNETVEQLLKSESFGAELYKENGWLKDEIKAATTGETDALQKAKKIYAFVQHNYTCVDPFATTLSQPLKKTMQLKKGNVADINILLAAMLRAEGYDADPVLLSTTNNGKTYDLYPILNKFNYLITQVAINDNAYLLDASMLVLGFGQLNQYCYNGNARLIDYTPLLINLSADSLREADMTTLFLYTDKDGRVSGTQRHVMGAMKSIEMRSRMKDVKGKESYFKEIKNSFSFDVNIDKTSIDSINDLGEPVSVQYNLSFKPEGDIFYFAPVLSDDIFKENPFTAARRFYPIEIPYCIDQTFIMNMEVPAGYKVDELPKSARVLLNNTEGIFEYFIQQSDNILQLQCRLKINKAIFEAEDYETLRNFFAIVVTKENEQIVFRKL